VWRSSTAFGAFGAADVVDGLGQLRLDVVAVEGDLGAGQVLQRAGQVALAHVLADLADLLGRTAVGGQIAGEAGVGAGVAAGGGEHDPRLVEVGEHRDVVLAAPKARLVDGDPRDQREVLTGERLIDVVVHHAPQAGVVLADQLADGGDRHLGDQGHDQRLEQQREPRARPRPRQADLTHPVLGAAHPRHARDQERLMLKEVQMPPALLGRVGDLAAGRVALRAGEPGAPLEVDAQLKAPPLGIEAGRHHPPAIAQAQSRLQQLDISHHALRSWTTPSARTYATATPLPTRNGEGPAFPAAPPTRSPAP
jgi:hypothetical protein